MRALLDVNVLIALLDSDHVSHTVAIEWFEANARHGWASCPISQNGCIRIMSTPSYRNALPVPVVMERLAAATGTRWHEFWTDDLSLLDPKVAEAPRLLGPRQLTDAYLLALAVRHGGRLVTFDTAVPLKAVRGAEPRHLIVL